MWKDILICCVNCHNVFEFEKLYWCGNTGYTFTMICPICNTKLFYSTGITEYLLFQKETMFKNLGIKVEHEKQNKYGICI